MHRHTTWPLDSRVIEPDLQTSVLFIAVHDGVHGHAKGGPVDEVYPAFTQVAIVGRVAFGCPEGGIALRIHPGDLCKGIVQDGARGKCIGIDEHRRSGRRDHRAQQ